MRYLVTGCAGFIGYHVTKELIKKKNQVVGIDSLNNYYDTKLKKDRLKDITQNNKTKFKFYKFNLSDKKKLKNVFLKNNFDIVIHLAAQAGVRYSIQNPFSYIENNIKSTTNLFEMCKNSKIKNFLVASSSSVYGNQNAKNFKETSKTDKPLSFYAATKISVESIAYAYSHLYNIPVKILRFFTVYGPWGRPDMAYYKFTRNIINKKKINIFNNGNHYRDFTYISDIVNFINIVANKKNKKKFDVINFGSNNPQRLRKFIDLIEKNLQLKVRKKFMKMQDGDMLGTHANMTYAKKNYNIKSKIKLEEGIKKFIIWYKKYHYKNKKN